MKLSPHFTLAEMVESARARRDPDMWAEQKAPPEATVKNLTRLCTDTLEPLRELLGGWPLQINSGWRCPDLNDAIGGSPTSQHKQGTAADIELVRHWTTGHSQINVLLERWREIAEAGFAPPPGRMKAEWFVWAVALLHAEELGINQLIHEYGDDPWSPKWVHIATTIPPRKPKGEALFIGPWTGAGSNHYARLNCSDVSDIVAFLADK